MRHSPFRSRPRPSTLSWMTSCATCSMARLPLRLPPLSLRRLLSWLFPGCTPTSLFPLLTRPAFARVWAAGRKRGTSTRQSTTPCRWMTTKQLFRMTWRLLPLCPLRPRGPLSLLALVRLFPLARVSRTLSVGGLALRPWRRATRRCWTSPVMTGCSSKTVPATATILYNARRAWD